MPAPTRSRRRSKSAGERILYIGLMTKLKVSSISYLPVYTSVRLPETQPESTNTTDLGQINDSNSANIPDSNDFIGLDALLQVLQSANATDVVSPPPPESFDFSRSYAHVSEGAAPIAVTAVNQLSQQEAPDIQYPGPFDSLTLSVRLFSRCYITFLPHNDFASTVPRLWFPDSSFRSPMPLSQPEDHNFPALLLLRQGSLAILRHPSAML